MSMAETILIGDSPAMARLRAMIEVVAPTRLSVLVEGATGTGKELVAALLHQRSRRTGAFVPFNVCALGESMFEDALFGHVRGAYTGALGESLGFLREANGGTAFLDEISGLPLPAQAKLLRAIETGVFRPIGSSRDAHSDFRAIAASNERIDSLVSTGRFRADLAHRLSGIVLTVPALAERADDVPQLAEFFIRRARPTQPTRLTSAAATLLKERDWPGNVRELKQVIDSALIFSRDTLDVDALVLVLMQRQRDREEQRVSRHVAERQRLLKQLEVAAWDTERVAQDLGVHRATVYRRMRRLGIEVPSTRGYDPDVGVSSRDTAENSIRTFASIRARLRDVAAAHANGAVSEV